MPRVPRGDQYSVAMYVYSTGGEPVGFVFETTIYDLEGAPLGRIVGCRVHRFDGTYVGEWFRDMVVRRPQGRPRIIPPAPVPPRRPPAGAPPTGCARWSIMAIRTPFLSCAKAAYLREAAE